MFKQVLTAKLCYHCYQKSRENVKNIRVFHSCDQNSDEMGGPTSPALQKYTMCLL